MLCGLADGIDALERQGARVDRVVLVGGGARSGGRPAIAPTVLGRPVHAPAPAEHVALGAARQAAWVLSGSDRPPSWAAGGTQAYDAPYAPDIRNRYAVAREATLDHIESSA